MKPTLLVRTISLIDLFIFIGALVISRALLLNIQDYWFPFGLILISVPLLVKGFILFQDASMYSGTLILCNAIVFVMSRFFILDFSEIYPFYIMCFALSSLVNFCLFRQNIHIKIFAFLSVLVLILLMYKLFIISATLFWSLFVVYALILTYTVASAIINSSRSME